MKASSGRAETKFHLAQSFKNSCQPACLAMALSRGGEHASVIEKRLLGDDDASSRMPPNHFTPEVPGASLLRETESVLTTFRTALARGAWVMVHVAGPLWVARLPPEASSVRGPLCPPGEGVFPLHAVLVVAASTASFFVLDPWHSPDGQPFEVTDAELFRCLSGFASTVIEA